jgi:hypothetical protein
MERRKNPTETIGTLGHSMRSLRRFLLPTERETILRELKYKEASRPESLNPRWFGSDGKPSTELLEKIEAARQLALSNPEILRQMGEIEVLDILVIGGQARHNSKGDLDLYILAGGDRLRNGAHPINDRQTYNALNLRLTKDFNEIEDNGTEPINTFIAERGKDQSESWVTT